MTWEFHIDMRMEDPAPTFSYLVTKLTENHPNLAYIHAVEPRVYGSVDLESKDIVKSDTNDIFRKIWGDRPFIVAGGFNTTEDIAETVRSKGGLVAIGRYYISNVRNYKKLAVVVDADIRII